MKSRRAGRFAGGGEVASRGAPRGREATEPRARDSGAGSEGCQDATGEPRREGTRTRRGGTHLEHRRVIRRGFRRHRRATRGGAGRDRDGVRARPVDSFPTIVTSGTTRAARDASDDDREARSAPTAIVTAARAFFVVVFVPCPLRDAIAPRRAVLPAPASSSSVVLAGGSRRSRWT